MKVQVEDGKGLSQGTASRDGEEQTYFNHTSEMGDWLEMEWKEEGRTQHEVQVKQHSIVSRKQAEETLGKSGTILGEKQRQKNVKGEDEKKEGAQHDSGAPET